MMDITIHKIEPIVISGTEDEIIDKIRMSLAQLSETAPDGDYKINSYFIPVAIVTKLPE